MQNHFRYSILLFLGVITMLLFTVSVSRAVDLESAFVIWLFDEGNGDTVEDQSEQGNTGEITGGNWVDGQFGGGLELATNETVTSFTANGVESEVISECLWIKFDNFNTEAQFGFIEGLGTASSRFFYFSSWINGGPPHDGIHLGVIDAGGAWGRGISVPKTFDEDEWYHVCGVADAEGGSLKAYVNGELVNDTPIPAADVPGEPSTIWVGGAPEGGRFVQGIIDEVVFFSTALTEDDIQEIMTLGLADAASVDPGGKIAVTWGSLKR